MEPVGYTATGNLGVLAAKVSGTFDGSPVILKYLITIVGGLIPSLRITG